MGKATHIDEHGYGRGGDPSNPSRFSEKEFPDGDTALVVSQLEKVRAVRARAREKLRAAFEVHARAIVDEIFLLLKESFPTGAKAVFWYDDRYDRYRLERVHNADGEWLFDAGLGEHHTESYILLGELAAHGTYLQGGFEEEELDGDDDLKEVSDPLWLDLTKPRITAAG